MHDLGVDAMETANDGKKTACDAPLDLPDLTTAEPRVVRNFGWTRDLIRKAFCHFARVKSGKRPILPGLR
jgi:hypothetical protein